MKNNEREVWVDWMRVIACFMVMVVHSTEPFYLGGDGGLILTRADMWWSAAFDSMVRMCVPLFVIASSYLQFPLHYSTGEFFKRRAVRVLVPFVLWSVVYAFYWGDPAENLRGLLLNFNYAAGHLWFVYMLLGVYLIMPLLSAWAREVGKRELQCYLGLWLFTTMLPMLRDWVAQEPLALTYGATGLPRQALFPLWGEASWNTYGTFYYVSGFVGYMLLGLYFRRFASIDSWGRTLVKAVPLYLAGFAITAGGFVHRVMATGDGSFPVAAGLDKAVWWETTWNFDSTGVALMAIATIMMLRKVTAQGRFYNTVLLRVSKASYGMYLAHMVVLATASSMLRDALGTGNEGMLGMWTTPIEIAGTALCTFVIVAAASMLMQRIPRVGKYIAG
ncbi:MAG: acyltransferase family protein [Muribaculaceae bacterium]|nr:acyltransferase family protein [Muribaculaceae bacterium]